MPAAAEQVGERSAGDWGQRSAFFSERVVSRPTRIFPFKDSTQALCSEAHLKDRMLRFSDGQIPGWRWHTLVLAILEFFA